MTKTPSNGGIIGVDNAATFPAAPGSWSMPCQMLARSQDKWPTYLAPMNNIDYLVIAGGGGGGSGGTPGSIGGGGGGAGGFRTSFPGGTQINILGPQTITIGAAGAGAPVGSRSTKGSNGGDSIFSTKTSAGGGFGGAGGPGPQNNGGPGGSGGGGGALHPGSGSSTGGTGNTPPTSGDVNPVQGFSGTGSVGPDSGGAGGGASAVGGSASFNCG